MSFRLTGEQQAIRKAVREFGENEIEPVARTHDEDKKYPDKIIRKAAKYDLVAPLIPEEYGGAGMDALSSAIVTEELWRADPGIGCTIGNQGFSTNVHILSKYGDE